MTIVKTIALIRWTFVGKVMSLLFDMLSRLVMEKEMATHSSVLAWRIHKDKRNLADCSPWGCKESDTTE